VAIIGAGIGGLVAAVQLACRGVPVVVLERAAAPGGKLREVEADGAPVDSGPTVFTLREVFEEIFADAGARLADHLSLRPLDVLARHAWRDGSRLDLHADLERSAAAIGAFAGADEARRFLAFAARARRVWATLEHTFVRAARPNPFELAWRVGLGHLPDLLNIRPFATLWRALGEEFRDPRLRQLYGRYATYCGSSPFHAPATLMLIAHVEQAGVWTVDGGMHRIPQALARLAAACGAQLRCRTHVAEVLVERGRACGVRLADGERIDADAVVMNGDAAALAEGLLGEAARRAVAPRQRHARSLSAVTWSMRARVDGFPLARHSVFFSDDYAAEFDDVFGRGRLPGLPTVYVCAQDRADAVARTPAAGAPPPLERLLVLVNAPALGDSGATTPPEIERCAQTTFDHLAHCGLRLEPSASVVTTPADFHRLYPGTGGALYGPASHGWQASFRRPGSRTRIPGLHLAGGSAHPGAGVPMAAISGRLAAESVLRDLASTSRSYPVAMPGGTSTR
jgi:1-hydroxycarotenoid 3,4-desaturase